MSIHIGGKAGDIADTVLLPGDPLRAKMVAETILEDASCYSEVRGMYGFTGSYQGKRVSVQGTGMGIPSISIYVNELVADYGAKTLVRIGTCGSIRKDMRLKDVILAMSACSDSATNRTRFDGHNFAPTADFDLLTRAYKCAQEKGLQVGVGSVLSTDTFYHDDPEYWKRWADYEVLAIEMETSALYTLAAKFHIKALSVLTVSDEIVTGAIASSEERQTAFTQMVEVALDAAL